jgi:hypothetical protein
MRRLLAHAFALLLPAAALAQGAPHPALTRLIPLTEVYDARNGGRDVPGFDVAGIRCAAMVHARDLWARQTPGFPRVPEAELREADTNLIASEIDRRQRLRWSATRASAATREDAQRVVGLYLARFEQNQRSRRHPWQGDPVLERDTIYCGFLNQPHQALSR